jgi:hypothetical protein
LPIFCSSTAIRSRVPAAARLDAKLPTRIAASLARLLFAGLLLLPLADPAAGHAQASVGGPLPQPLPLLPRDNWWNVDVSLAPVDGSSSTFISWVGTGRGLHPDFGGDVNPGDPSNI